MDWKKISIEKPRMIEYWKKRMKGERCCDTSLFFITGIAINLATKTVPQFSAAKKLLEEADLIITAQIRTEE